MSIRQLASKGGTILNFAVGRTASSVGMSDATASATAPMIAVPVPTAS